MIQLLIDGKEAVLPGKTTFKLVRCNPYFDVNKGDYTFEVKLPLQGSPQNLAIFGPVHRGETSLHTIIGHKYPMTLTAPPLSIKGYACIKNITEKTVQVQLVAGRSAIEHGLTNIELYIDDLDLGNAWDEFQPFDARDSLEGTTTYYPGSSLEEMKRIFYEMPHAINSPGLVKLMAWGKFGETDCVAFRASTPPINQWETGGSLEFYDTHVNPWLYERVTTPTEINYRLRMSVQNDATGIRWSRTQLAPMPYLFDIIPRIIRAIGYDVGYHLENLVGFPAWMRNILIANTNVDIRRAKCLPHWTIGKFLTEIQRLFGAVWTIRNNSIDLIPVHLYYKSNNLCQISEVLDEFEAEIDEDSDYEGTSGANIDYVWPSMDDKLKLPDEVFESAELVKFPDEDSMGAYYSDLDTDTQSQSHQLYEVDRSYWASLHNADGLFDLVKVDQAGALINSQNGRDIDIELNIVPCMIEKDGFLRCTRYYRPSLYNIDAAINNDGMADNTEKEERDVMELACNDGDEVWTNSEAGIDYTIPTAVGFPWLISEVDGLPEIPQDLRRKNTLIQDGRFSLKSVKNTIGDSLKANLKTIDSRVEKTFEFVDNILLDPTVPYLINGRVYACHKMEITLDENGVQKLKRGYFFELV